MWSKASPKFSPRFPQKIIFSTLIPAAVFIGLTCAEKIRATAQSFFRKSSQAKVIISKSMLKSFTPKEISLKNMSIKINFLISNADADSAVDVLTELIINSKNVNFESL